jgi:putative membrane protein
MRPLISALALTAVLSVPAFAADKMDNSDISAMKQLAQANLNEIASGKAAQSKAQSPDVKSFAQKMVTDHTRMLDDLRALAKKKDVALPQDQDVKDMAQTKLLERKSGGEFDQAYMEDMVKDHQKDVKETQDIASKAKDPEFKAAVQKAHATIQEHLQLAQRISKSAAAGSSSKK